MLKDLFARESDSEDEDASVFVAVGDLQLNVFVAESEGAVKQCLFATHVWAGSRVLAEFVWDKRQELIQGKTVIELGCGAAVPGLVAAKSGAGKVALTDFPSDSLLENVRRNVKENGFDGGQDAVKVFGHLWGSQVDELLDYSGPQGFDVVLASECVWCHDRHDILLTSMDRLAHKENGVVLMTFSHHVPGYEKEDMSILVKAERFGFKATHIKSVTVPQMWSKEKESTMFLYMLHREACS